MDIAIRKTLALPIGDFLEVTMFFNSGSVLPNFLINGVA